MSNGTAALAHRLDEVQSEIDLQRVKVYRLNADGNWDDKGQGLITLQHLEQSAAMGVIVMAESAPNKPLLIHRLSREDIYTQSGNSADETIISWSDGEAQTEIALSFQEAAGCRRFWGQIQLEQARTRSQLSGERGLRPMIDEMEPSAGNHEEMREDVAAAPVKLPPPELKNLEQIAKTLAELTMAQKEQAANTLVCTNYIQPLLEIFKACEDLEDTESLQLLFEIMKFVIMLNDTNVLEFLFYEDHVMDMVGMLEYDPELGERQRHRQWLREVVVFKEVVPLNSPELRAKIHQTYRMSYVRDVILPRLLDDATYATLTSLIMFTNIEVVTALMEEEEQFFGDLFAVFRASPPGSEAWADCISFLQELVQLFKSLRVNQRIALLTKLTALGLFEVLTQILEHGNQQMQMKATDVLISAVQHDAAPLRAFLLSGGSGTPSAGSEPSNLLFNRLIQLLTSGADSGLQEQVTEILRMLLDPLSMSQSSEKDDFLEKFYSSYIGQLMGVVDAGQKGLRAGEGPSPAALGLILELLCFCVGQHGYRIKYFILKHGVMERVLGLLRCRQTRLVLAAIRFIRHCLSVKDNFYQRHMVEHNILEPIITVFVENGERYNLLNSVVLEMVDFIKRESKMLTVHFMDKHFHRVAGVDYDRTFQKLKEKFEQFPENSTESRAASAQLQAQRIRKDDRAMDKDEESYFDADDEDEFGRSAPAGDVHTNGSALGLPGLVDYDDDDDDQPAPDRGKREGGPLPPPQGVDDKRPRFGEHSEPRGFSMASSPLMGSPDWG